MSTKTTTQIIYTDGSGRWSCKPIAGRYNRHHAETGLPYADSWAACLAEAWELPSGVTAEDIEGSSVVRLAGPGVGQQCMLGAHAPADMRLRSVRLVKGVRKARR